MSEPEVHYISFPTKDAQGKETGLLQIPVMVRADLSEGKEGELQALIDPGRMFWFSLAAQKAAFEKIYPDFARKLKEEQQ